MHGAEFQVIDRINEEIGILSVTLQISLSLHYVRFQNNLFVFIEHTLLAD